MYRHCIFCSADLRSNDTLERFPVGRSVAFDTEKGRLWAVCPRCARWNLAPLEERWEAVDDAERLFRDTRTRVQNENIGLAKLRDGTRLVRVGNALAGELAAWRYGTALGARRRRYNLAVGGAVLVAAASVGTAALGFAGAGAFLNVAFSVWRKGRTPFQVERFPAGTLLPSIPVFVDTMALEQSHLAVGPDGTVALHLPRAAYGPTGKPGAWAYLGATLTGPDAHRVLRRGLVTLNAGGASRTGIRDALGLLSRAGAGGFLERCGTSRLRLVDPQLDRRDRRTRLLAVEMALHDETERQALQGELAALEAMWRQAEEIAAIADALPGAVSAPEPPRIPGAR